MTLDTPLLNQIIYSWGHAVPDQFVHFSGRPYFIVSIMMSKDLTIIPTTVPLNPTMTPYALLFCRGTCYTGDDIAHLGYSLDERVAEIRQIQGAFPMTELSTVDWDRALICSFMELGIQIGVSQLRFLPGHLVEGGDYIPAQRLHRRYDCNAMLHGFEYDPAIDRYVRYLNTLPQTINKSSFINP